jgi:hypothetical protein
MDGVMHCNLKILWHIYPLLGSGKADTFPWIPPEYRNLALQVGGVLRTGTIEYGLESCGTQAREGLRWGGPAATVNYRPVLSSERAPHINKPANV